MGKLKAGSGLNSISATAMNRVFDLTKDKIGPVDRGNIDVQRQYTYAVGRNDCGFDLLPGAPVRIGAFFPQESTAVVPRIGWYSLTPAFYPRTAPEYTTHRNNMWSIGVMLDYCANTKLARFAISGVVDCKVFGFGWFAGLYESSEIDHQSFAKASYAMGFGRVLAVMAGNWAKVELGCAVGPKLLGTASGNIVAGSAGVATLRNPLAGGWAASAHTVPAWTVDGTIDSGSLVELSPCDGRHHAVKLCPT